MEKHYSTQSCSPSTFAVLQGYACDLRKALLLFLVMAFSMPALMAQIAVVQNANSQSLAQLLAGSGVTITNYTLTCNANGTGTFNNVNSILGMPGGVVMASGRVSNIPQSATNFASTSFTATGDAQLSTLTSGTIYDPCVLEFDIVPQGPLLKFDYVFASEEYPEFVCSPYNDVFGFFITGPNPGGGNFAAKNIATIPNSTMPVAINTVNGGGSGTYNGTTWNSNNCQSLSNTAYYRDNLNPLNGFNVYDGMTTVLQAQTAVVPCQTYHLKIAIADVADRIYDSGVFLNAYSFTSNPVSISAVAALDYAGFSSAYEGCVGGTFTLTLSQIQTVDVYVNLVISGTATNGTDYTAIPTTVMIPAGQASISLNLNPLADGITEPAETVTLSTVNPCNGAVSSSATITMRDDLPPTITASDTTLCLGQSALLIASGGLTYAWSPATGLSNANVKNPIATPTVTTTYTCSMTFGSCVKTVSQTIYVSNPSLSITAAPAASICNGGTILLSATPTNGMSPYSYLWSTGATAPSLSAIAGGAYTLTATDAFGCTANASKTISISSLNVTGVARNISCIGGTDGSVDITVTGSNAPFSYDWGGGIVSQDRTNVIAGTYTVTVSNTVGCSVSSTYTITQPTTNLTTSATSIPVFCNGDATGSIDLTTNGGVSPYSFAWSNAAVTQDLINVTANTYSVTVTDFNGCTTTRSVIVSQPAALTLAETHTDASCNGSTDGSINITISGGTPPYTYGWNDGVTTQNRTAIAGGTYTFTATDSKGCDKSISITIAQPTGILVSATVTDATCAPGNNGAITTSVSGGSTPYLYNWGGGITTPNRTALFAGTYTVTVTDNIGCTTAKAISVSQNGTGITLATAHTNISCNGGNNGTITLTTSGGTSPITYNWGGGITAPNRTNLGIGNYSVTVTDGLGCSAISNSTITQPALLSLSANVTNVLCNGTNTGSITISVNGGTGPFAFNWGGGVTTQNRTALPAGSYSVTATDANGCTATSGSIIVQPATVISFTAVSSPVSCFGGNNGSISLTVSGGTGLYSYLWSNGSVFKNLTNVVAGTYQVTISDVNACTVTTTAVITQPASALTSVLSPTNLNCNGVNTGSINNAVTGGTSPYQFSWNDAVTTQNRTALSAGVYSITVTDNKNCSVTSTTTITQPAPMNISESLTSVSCAGGNNGAITLSIIGGMNPYSFNWGGGITTQNRTGLSGDNYTVTVSDANACSLVDSILIYEPNVLSLVTSITNVACNAQSNGDITLTVTGGTGNYSYNWGAGITTQNRSNLIAGTYSVTVNDANACSASTTAIITQPNGLSIALSASSVSCFGGTNGSITSITSGGTSPFNYLWNDGNINDSRSSLNAGTYAVTVTDDNACTASSTITITQPSTAVSVAVISASTLTCYGNSNGTISISASGGVPAYSFSWGDGSTLQNRTGMMGGTYFVTVTDQQGCNATTSATIIQPASSITVDSMVVTDVRCFNAATGAITISVSGGLTPYSYNWGGGITTPNRINLTAGNYSVTVTDNNGCSTSSFETISQPASGITIAPTITNITCNGGNNGAINLNVSGGVTPYSFNWGGGVNLQNRTNLGAGTYTLIATDSNNCSASVSSNITQPNSISILTSVTNVSCFGANNGAINTSVAGGTSAYTYNWGGGVATPNRAGLGAGSYTVSVSDANGCTATAMETISEPTLISASTVATNVSCFGGSTGAINVTVTGGTTPYIYNWSDGALSQNRTSLSAGTYNLTVSDANACSAVATANVIQPVSALSVIATPTNATCNGGNNGAISLTVSGGTNPYTFDWGGGVVTQNRTAINAGTYSVTVIDAGGCSATSGATITEPAPISITLSAANIVCNGNNNGSITLAATGGITPYSYAWHDGVLAPNRIALNAGAYSVTVSDANACSAISAATITQPAAVLAAISATGVSCFGQNTGSINLTVTGGVVPYTYNWGDGAISQNRTGLSAGTYSVSVSDANACTTIATANIIQPASALSVIANATNATCNGGNNGAINLNVSGGTSPYSFDWSGGITTQNRTLLNAGAYSVTVNDASACSATASANITQPTPISITLSATNIACSGNNSGSITLIAAGGITPYSYIWNDGIVTPNRSSLNAGTYSVALTDINGCTASSSATVSQPTAISATTLATNVLCFGGNNGAITLSATGGTTPYYYNWGGGIVSQNRTSLTAGSYNVTVNDANGCSVTTSALITQPLSSLSAIVSATNVTCNSANDGAINLAVNGGASPYQFNWGSGVTSQNRTTLTAGTYSVSISDGNACTATASATITQPSPITVNLGVTNISCNGGNNGAISLTANGGVASYTYLWNGGATTASRINLTAGTYTVTVTNSNACSVSSSAIISQPGLISVSLLVTNVLCHGGNTGSIGLATTGGTTPYFYNWGAGITTPSRSNLTVGTYSVTINDANNCSLIKTVNVNEPTVLGVTSTPVDVTCNGGVNGNVYTNPTGGTPPYAYLWNTGAIKKNLMSIASGSYSVTVSDANNCSASASAAVAQPAALQIAMAKTDPKCNGTNNGAIDITVTGGVSPMSYIWNTGGQVEDPSQLSAGTYSVSVTDGHGCVVTGSANLVMPDALVLSETHTAPKCYNSSNGSISVSTVGGTAPFTYQWTNSSSTSSISNLAPGVYGITVSDANGCAANLSAITLSEPAFLGATISATNGACSGMQTGSANATINGGTAPYHYHWSNGSSYEDLANVGAGTYNVTITDANGCSQTDNAVIASLPQPKASGAADELLCANANGGIDLSVNNGTMPYTFHWSNGATSEDLNNVHAGEYSVTVSDANGCKFDTSFVIVNLNSFSVTASGGGTITLGQTSELHVVSSGSAQTEFSWTPVWGIACTSCADVTVQPARNTLYTVIGVDTNGCEAQDTVSVNVIEDHALFAPNAFTPNGDGNNDYFQLFGNLAGIKKINIMIFDRWGEKVFESNDVSFIWDGFYKGELMQPTVCVYVLKAVFLDGNNEKVMKGSVTIVR